MVTFILILLVGTGLLFVSVASGYRKHVDSHRWDSMAGDEGED